MRIAILVFPGVEEMDFIGPWEALRIAAREDARLQVELCSFPHREQLTAACGLEVTGIAPLTGRYDLVVVPGGGWLAGGDTGVRKAIADDLPEKLREIHAAGVVLASICTGAMILAAGGILQGRRATTHESAKEDLRAYGVEVSEARVVDEGDIVSSGGVTSGLDLALWLTERFLGPALAGSVATYLEYERQGVVERRA